MTSDCDCLTCKVDHVIREHYGDVLEPEEAAHVIQVFDKILSAMLDQNIIIAVTSREEVPDVVN